MPFGYDNPFVSSRVGNIFSQPYDRTPQLGSEGKRQLSIPMSKPQNIPHQREGSGVSDYMNEINRIMSNRPARSAYQQAVQEQPEYQAPGKVGRLGAILTGVAGGFAEGPTGGIRAAENLLYGGYNREMEAYNQRLAGLRDVAGMESEDIGTQVGAAGTAANLGVSYRDYLLGKEGHDITRAGQAEQGRQFDVSEARQGREFATSTGLQEMQLTIQQNQALANLEHMRNQARTDSARLALDRDKVEIEKGNAKIMEKYYGQMGEAAVTNANNPRTGGLTMSDLENADEFSWKSLADDPDWADAVIYNPDRSGPMYTFGPRVNEERRREVLEEIERRKNMFLGQKGTRPGRAGGPNSDWSGPRMPTNNADQASPYKIGPVERR